MKIDTFPYHEIDTEIIMNGGKWKISKFWFKEA